jgi:hypothetical protein
MGVFIGVIPKIYCSIHLHIILLKREWNDMLRVYRIEKARDE